MSNSTNSAHNTFYQKIDDTPTDKEAEDDKRNREQLRKERTTPRADHGEEISRVRQIDKSG